ncbi:MAG: AraC family transcriptional regulator [Eubacteriales bacterium]|nr:AraC family transcriptional regulator [Eubacteriales bacterium]
MLYSFHIFSGRHFVDMGIYQTGHEQCAPGQLFGPVAREHFLFHYVLKGKGTLLCPDSSGELRKHEVQADEGFLILPGWVTTYFADADNPWEYAWIEFDGLRAKEGIDFAGFSKDSPVYHSRLPLYNGIVREEMLYIAGHPEESILHIVGHLYLLFDALIRSSKRESMSPGHSIRDFYVHDAIAYIETNYQKDISVEEIAKSVGLNRSYFGKIFKEMQGKSPQAFLLAYRMSKAAELLQDTKLSVAEIGAAVGYQNQLHFSRAFKGVYGISPRAWRNRNRSGIFRHEEEPG